MLGLTGSRKSSSRKSSGRLDGCAKVLYDDYSRKSSFPNPSGRRKKESIGDETLFSLDSDKDIYSKVVQLSSIERVQSNWSRVFRRELDRIVIDESSLFLSRIGDDALDFRAWISPSRPRATTHEPFLRRAQRLDARGQTDAALDLLYDGFDELLRSGGFSEVDLILTDIAVDDYSVDILLGVLTATLPARSRLIARSSFYRSVAESIQRRGEAEEGLLTGLA
jgi:hypothetical protein